MATVYDAGLPVQGEPVFGNGELKTVKAKTFVYDFTKMGGAIGDYILGKLPINAVLLDIAGYWTTALAGGTAVTLGSASAGAQFMADMVTTGQTADTLIQGVAKADTQSRIALAADTSIYLTCTGAITAGRLVATFIYFVTDIA
jgi:hypothetical protein